MATKTAMDMDMVNINQETLFNKMEFPYVVPVEDLKHIHPYIKSLFCARKIPNVQLTRRLKTFSYSELENSEKRHRNSVVSRGLHNTYTFQTLPN